MKPTQCTKIEAGKLGLEIIDFDLRSAVDALLAGRPLEPDQTPGIGCNIKWKPGNEPDYT